jgi:hypothetical protein
MKSTNANEQAGQCAAAKQFAPVMLEHPGASQTC